MAFKKKEEKQLAGPTAEQVEMLALEILSQPHHKKERDLFIKRLKML